jgi:glycosyltransferase involved in cell wall biosynthesis
VLLPVRDAAATLEECLDSLATQTLGHHEVVAVDDGSSDACWEILRAAAARDPRVRPLRSPGRGLVTALNLAAQRAAAPLLARMDADDVAAPERLARQAARLASDPGLDVLGSRVRLVGAPGPGMRRYVEWQNGILDHDAIVEEMLVESPLAHPSVMMRAEALRQLGGYRELAGPEDYDLWLRAWRCGLRFGKLPELLLDWRDGPGRLSRRDARYSSRSFFALKLAALEAGPLARRRPLVIWGAGPTGKTWGRALSGRGFHVAAFVDVAPRRLGARILGAPVVTAEAASGFPGCLHLSAVGLPEARRRIRVAAVSLGLTPGADLVAVA